MSPTERLDAIVVGAGPAGLTAAMYLARYRRSVLVLHDGCSRALRIPKTHNAPAFPDGVTGPDLIDRMSDHATRYGARIERALVQTIARTPDGFMLTSDDGMSWQARSVILATGITLNEIDLPHEVHEQAIRDGVLRYCPVCDGYEHIDTRIGVIGCDTNGAAEALFLRQFSEDIALMPLSHPELTQEQQREMAEAEIAVETGALQRIEPHSDRIDVHLEGRGRLSFDVLYPALGSRARSELAEQLGVSPGEGGCLAATCASESGVPGVFAAGDVVEGLDQISVAMGHGALASTKAHNWLRAQDQETLQARV